MCERKTRKGSEALSQAVTWYVSTLTSPSSKAYVEDADAFLCSSGSPLLRGKRTPFFGGNIRKFRTSICLKGLC